MVKEWLNLTRGKAYLYLLTNGNLTDSYEKYEFGI